MGGEKREDLDGRRGCYKVRIEDTDLVVKPKETSSVFNYLKAYSDTLDPGKVRSLKKEISVLHELIILEIAKARYRREFGEELPVETVVGGFIGPQGQKYTFYKVEQRENEELLDLGSVGEELRSKMEEWYSFIRNRLLSVG